MTAVLEGVEIPVLDRDVRRVPRASRSNSLLRDVPYRRDQPINNEPDDNVRPSIITSNIHYFADKIFAARRYLGKIKLKASLDDPPAKGAYRGQVKFRMVHTGPHRSIEYAELVPYSPENIDLNRLMVEKLGEMKDRAPRGLRMMIDGYRSIAVL